MTSDIGVYYDRKFKIIINTGEFIKTIESPTEPEDHALTIAFQIVKTADVKANDAELTIYNLNKDSRDLIIKNANVEIHAGYKNLIGMIFKGTVEFVSHTKQGTDWETKIVCRDGALAWRESGISVCFEKGTSIDKVIDKLIQTITLPPNLENKFREINKIAKGKIDNRPTKQGTTAVKATAKSLSTGFQRYADIDQAARKKQIEAAQRAKLVKANQSPQVIKLEKAEIIKGASMQILDLFCQTFGMKAVLSDQCISIKPVGSPIDEDIVYLTPESGLIGSPEPIEKGGYRIVSLLRHDYRIYSDIAVLADGVDGIFRIKRVEYNGEKNGQNWYATIEGDPV